MFVISGAIISVNSLYDFARTPHDLTEGEELCIMLNGNQNRVLSAHV